MGTLMVQKLQFGARLSIASFVQYQVVYCIQAIDKIELNLKILMS